MTPPPFVPPAGDGPEAVAVLAEVGAATQHASAVKQVENLLGLCRRRLTPSCGLPENGSDRSRRLPVGASRRAVAGPERDRVARRPD
ncbi:MAG TPA: hypothetical protein VG846_16590, partial [Actinomycetota bacterium]|nr:hypothetical protein [Actinomycetota bacterium]